MEEIKIPKINKRRVTTLYIVAIISLLIAFFVFYLFFVDNVIMQNVEAIANFFGAINPNNGAFPISGEMQLLTEICGRNILTLLGLGGLVGVEGAVNNIFTVNFNGDITTLGFQIAAWVVTLVFVILFIIQIILFPVKRRGSYLFHTFFGIIATYIILCMLSSLSYLFVTDASSFLYSGAAENYAYLETYTFVGISVPEGLTSAEFAAYWVSKVVTLVGGIFAAIFVLCSFMIAFHITTIARKVPSARKIQKLTYERRRKEEILRATDPYSGKLLTEPDNIPVGVPLADGTVVATSKRGAKLAKKDGLIPISYKEAQRRAQYRKDVLGIKGDTITSTQDKPINGAVNGTPYIVQYFYNGEQKDPTNKQENVENKATDNVKVEKPLTKEDIKKVFQELLEEQKASQVQQPADTPKEEAKPASTEEKKDNVVTVNGVPYIPVPIYLGANGSLNNQNNQETSKEELVNLALEELDKEFDLVDYEDIKNFISSEIERVTTETVKTFEKQREETEKARKTVTTEEATLDDEVPAKIVLTRDGESEEEKTEVKTTTPIVVAMPSDYSYKKEETVTEDEVRNIIKEQLNALVDSLKPVEEEAEPVVKIQFEDVIVKEAVTEEKPVVTETPKEEKVEETKVVNEVKEEPKEEVKEEKVEAPLPEVKEEPVEVVTEEPKEEVKKTPIIPQKEVRGKEKNIEKGEVVNLAFDERMVASEDDIKNSYQTLKSLLLSYGLNSRVSSTGDTFRLSKKTYCKITLSGSALKIYLALDPKSYVNSAIPVNDSSSKEAYKQIPLGFRVKSDLSLRRARDLIIDCMNQNGLIPEKDFVEEDYIKKLEENISK